MTDIYLHSQKVNSVFQLLGEHENDISYSVAWALAQSPSYVQELLKKVADFRGDTDDIQIRLQHREGESGITDIEIEIKDKVFLIVEAKRGWNLPSKNQLMKYARRQSFKKSLSPIKRLVVLSECSREYANHNLETTRIDDIQITPFSWKDMAACAKKALKQGSNAEKRLLQELLTYLGGLMTMQNLDSNWVYVLSLGNGTNEGWGISWIDIVKKRKRYFHPVGGNGWTKEPPNYIAFRYSGKLQSIHHVEGYEIVTNLHDTFAEIPDEELPPHFIYKLGPAFSPAHEVKTGNIYPNGRVWCMLDTLFTYDTIFKARDASKKRQSKIQDNETPRSKLRGILGNIIT